MIQGNENRMSQQCTECGAELIIPSNMEKGDILSCPDCGVDYVIELAESGCIQAREINLEEEDWGE